MSLFKTILVLAAVLVAAQATTTAFVWVFADGTVNWTSDSFPLNVTRIATGHYCIHGRDESTVGVFNYAALTATLQTNGIEVPIPGYVVTNTGWGDDCNPYGGIAVYTYDNTATLADSAFSAVLNWNGQTSKPKQLLARK
ncbi:membrane-associated protein, putative [Bodo saltans]|uniref:Membrane-associated protein, putative n=1 Tax=Bodo saltans TaxID=75058 RepID=A0A0S4J3Z1_BODSA|nr:membrane-associated protein, putative [Bodo saltans]|eukprot:CUG86157.1 membrane-associated protein, putative [Bodo saltans]